MIADLLPGDATSAELFRDVDERLLFPDERAIIARAVEPRRGEFAAGRWCARLALAKLGIAPLPILCGDQREPKWPSGIVGSITHCAGYRAAVVARSTVISSLGIDAEPHTALPPGVLREISLTEESEALRCLRVTHPSVHWDRLLFCAKEATYKAWFPLTRRWLGFDQAQLTFDPDMETFQARILRPTTAHDGRLVDRFQGRWLVRKGLIVVAIVVLPQPLRTTAGKPERRRADIAAAERLGRDGLCLDRQPGRGADAGPQAGSATS